MNGKGKAYQCRLILADNVLSMEVGAGGAGKDTLRLLDIRSSREYVGGSKVHRACRSSAGNISLKLAGPFQEHVATGGQVSAKRVTSFFTRVERVKNCTHH